MRDIPHLLEENKEIERSLARQQAKNAALYTDIESLVTACEIRCCCADLKKLRDKHLNMYGETVPACVEVAKIEDSEDISDCELEDEAASRKVF